MTLKELKLSVNETYDFGNYSDEVKNCTSLFEGVYAYGCPESNTIAGYAECDAFKGAIEKTVGNVIAQNMECKDDGEDCGRHTTFRMYLFRNYHNHNIFKIRHGLSDINHVRASSETFYMHVSMI